MKQLLLFLSLWLAFIAESGAIERRGPQFKTEPSYLIFPLPYSIAGIGQGTILTGLAGNIAGTNTDAYALGIFGDAEGSMLAVEDIHILPESFIVGFSRQKIDKATVNYYETRGMDSDIDDYKLIGVNKVISDYAEAIVSLWDRRLELYGKYESQEAYVINIRDAKGNLIADLDDPFVSEYELWRYGVLLDYTDDREDPKKGIRYAVERKASPPQSSVDPDYFTIDHSLSFYIPLGESSTWAFNVFRSDAFVTKKGDTDLDHIRQELGLFCHPTDTACLEAEAELLSQFQAERAHGTASSLGGQQRLRSYPGGRYNGAHTLYYATEFRWNISEEVRPFNFGIWKDVATGIQMAFFYESGSVAETEGALGDITRNTYGAGMRLVSASGYVYRADYAAGDEGEELTVIFSYPW